MVAINFQSLVLLGSAVVAKIVLTIATELCYWTRLLAFAANLALVTLCGTTNSRDLELVNSNEISEKLAQTARWDRVRLTTFRARDLTFSLPSAGRLLQTLQTEGVATRQDFGLGK